MALGKGRELIMWVYEKKLLYLCCTYIIIARDNLYADVIYLIIRQFNMKIGTKNLKFKIRIDYSA